MAVWIIRTDLHSELPDSVILVDSVTEHAFGPVIRDPAGYEGGEGDTRDAYELAQGFLNWLPDDARGYVGGRLSALYEEYIREQFRN